MSGLDLNEYIINNDPIAILNEFISMINDFNKDRRFKYLTYLYRLYVKKIRYPIFRYRVQKFSKSTMQFLVDHPDYIVFVVNRLMEYFIIYCRVFNVKFNDLLNQVIPNNQIEIELFTEDNDIDNEIKLNGYNIIARYSIPLINMNDDMSDKEFREMIKNSSKSPKYTLSTLNIDLTKEIFDISQIVYNTSDGRYYNSASILMNKNFRLGTDGKLYNPNYAIDKNLLKEDLNQFKIMILHLLSPIISFIEITSNVKIDLYRI